MVSANIASESVQLKDGTIVDLQRVQGVDDATWKDMKNYLAENPETAKNLQKFAKDPEAMRGWLQTQAIADHYSKKLGGEQGDATLQDKLKKLKDDPELAPFFEAISKNGLEEVMNCFKDEELMLKISQKMGGLPRELQATLQEIDDKPLTVHEAAKMGNIQALQEYVDSKAGSVDAKDSKGITPLGYAIGCNRIAAVKILLDNRANPFVVDSQGNSGLHYAAGYGRNELVEYLLKKGCSPDQPNAQGQTPVMVTQKNGHQETLEIMKKK